MKNRWLMALWMVMLLSGCDDDGDNDCTPTTCADEGADCGEMDDGCGETLDCGTCTAPNTCGGGGTDNVCGCTADCSELECGPDPVCGIECGTCEDNASCGNDSTCSCDFLECGDSCCADDQVCHEDACCTPECEGRECGDDGCGGECGPGCDDGDTCTFGACIPGEWIWIGAGEFTMGSPEDETGHQPGETVHRVTLTRDFEIQSTEVTQDQFEIIMGDNPSIHTLCGGNCPVDNVNWHEAAEYCNALSEIVGIDPCYTCIESEGEMRCQLSETYSSPYECLGIRLPTEAEWEFAVRAGITAATYNGEITDIECSAGDVLNAISWYCGNSDDTNHPVAELLPNSWGLYDMLGNVHEWCHDWEVEDLGSDPVTDPFGPDTGEDRTYRGGGWPHVAHASRAASRNHHSPDNRYYYIGFRPVRTLDH